METARTVDEACGDSGIHVRSSIVPGGSTRTRQAGGCCDVIEPGLSVALDGPTNADTTREGTRLPTGVAIGVNSSMRSEAGNTSAKWTAQLPVSTFTAVTVERFGDVADLQLRTTASHPLQMGQIRIQITVAGLNPVDWQIVESRELAEQFGITTPAGYGNDFAGVVTETTPSSTRWKVGDRVYGGARGKALSTSVVLDQNHPSLYSTPDSISDCTAGVLDIAGRTASAVADALAIRRGETVLIGAAGGGVGSILTQLLVHAGTRVIGSGSAGSADFIRTLGAVPVEYGSSLERNVRAIGIGPIAAAADLHGVATATAALALGVDPHRTVSIESDTPPAGAVAVNGSDARQDALPRLTELIAAGRLDVPIAAVYPLDEFHKAIAHQRSRHVNGKIAVDMR